MKTLISFIISSLLIVLLLAPTILMFEDGQNSIVIELNEGEKNKEEKKGHNENDPYLNYDLKQFATSEIISFNYSVDQLVYLEINYSNTQEIFLPPPKPTI